MQGVTFEPLLNDEQAAALLSIHPKTLQRLARSRQIPAHRVGRYWRYRVSEIDTWLRNSQTAGVESGRQLARVSEGGM
jgi:excisionase family DNA binding protein